jgi:glycosyltransferase involved in cell wall biosynthesis
VNIEYARRIAASKRSGGANSGGATATTFSVVIPTYNEAGDIGETIAGVLAQTLPAIEVIVVDGGSVDGTVEKLRAMSAGGRVTVIEEGRRRGVSAARNAGMRAASGDVIVILNADVLLPPDFLARLAERYAQGDIDLLSVDSEVSNLDAFTGRYIHAVHRLKYGAASVGWSEGFSCRREAALGALFPEEIPGAGGEDVEFVDRLLKAGRSWKVDYSICVKHRVPDTWRGFWAQFRGRGRAVPYIEHGLRKWPLALVTAVRAMVLAKTVFTALLLVPNAMHALQLAEHSPRGQRDAPVLWVTHHAMLAAHRTGEWQTLIQLWRARKGRR